MNLLLKLGAIGLLMAFMGGLAEAQNATTLPPNQVDPCYNYTVLDQPWRATNSSLSDVCDHYFDWRGWYRLMYYGMNIRMPEVSITSRCSNGYSLWLKESHPTLQDGIVTRRVCAGWNGYCDSYYSLSIRVKACPGDFYIYEFVKPYFCNAVYCADINTITPTNDTTGANITDNDMSMTNSSFDPCNNYTVLDDYWRTVNYYYTGYDDTLVQWKGWYRLYLQNQSAQISEDCVLPRRCGGYTSLFLNGSHPKLEDGIVQRQIIGSDYSECDRYSSNPIQVKACPGNYYVYKLVRPELSIPMPSYCTAIMLPPEPYDPCSNYTVLDQPWRATNSSQNSVCDSYSNFRGWYRLMYYGMSIRMPEFQISSGCNTDIPLWMNGLHPTLQDGIVTRRICGSTYGRSCYPYYSQRSIRVKACPGDFYVYNFLTPNYCNAAYCADVNTITPTNYTADVIAVNDTTMTNPSFDPCNNYTVLDDYWRTVNYGNTGHDDTLVQWKGWYRFYLQNQSAQISEDCVLPRSCGGFTSLFLNDSHPSLKDGIVQRQIVGSDYNTCDRYRSNPIQVKACPGNYYVYKLIKPELSIPLPSYCTAIMLPPEAYDPCSNYTVLDQPWRATNSSQNSVCDSYSNFRGWYRLMYYGMSIRIPEFQISSGCNTGTPLWMNGLHPTLQDGIITRKICGSTYGGSCSLYHNQWSIRVKACPGDFYVYKFTTPNYCNAAYCADVNTITPTNYTADVITVNDTTMTNSSFDPCNNYTVLDDYWRTVNYGNTGHDDTLVQWNGWYRFYLQNQNAQISEDCVSRWSCGGFTSLFLNDSHPSLKDGIVQRQIVGSDYNTCDRYRSNPIQVKACPGNYYVYKLIKPELSIPMPSYCTAIMLPPEAYDPCSNYTVLDQPWRATNSSQNSVCDSYSNFRGWYRLMYYGMSIRMPEFQISSGCNTGTPLWMNGLHPTLQDGIITRKICGFAYGGSCSLYHNQWSIRVKACPDDFYVYKFITPNYCNAAYCADISTITPTNYTDAVITDNNMSMTNSSFDPCNNYTVLDDYWRSVRYDSIGHDDTLVQWKGWYRFYLQGISAQMPEDCASYMRCGGYTPLSLNGSHPALGDGIVQRQIIGSSENTCDRYRSKPIQVKACPGNYYVYRLVKPELSIPIPSYCAVTLSPVTVDPCYNYTILDEAWRSVNSSYYYAPMCDSNKIWQGWYRLYYQGRDAKMPEYCVGYWQCGNWNPLYLNAPHPQLQDGIVTRRVCVSNYGSCCQYKSYPIRVKACPGNYYVYEFQQPKYGCTYCTEILPEPTINVQQVLGVRMKFIAARNLTDTQIQQTVIQKLQDELVRRGLHNATRVRLKRVLNKP